MKRWPWLVPLVCLFLLTRLADLSKHAPVRAGTLVAREPAPDAEAELKEYRSVQTAIKSRITRTAPQTVKQPGYLGVSLDEETKQRAVIAHVQPGSPAAQAGLLTGDVITEVSGIVINTPAQFRDQVQSHTADEALRLILERQGLGLGTKVTLGAVSRPLTGSGERPVLGVIPMLADGGLKLERVTPGSSADKAGLKAEDVLLKLDGQKLDAIDSLSAELGKRKAGDTVTLVMRRDGKESEIKVTLAASERGGRPSGWDNRQQSMFKKDTYRLAVLPIEYSDAKHNAKVPTAEWDKALFSTKTYTDKNGTGQPVYGSLNDYYLEQSCGAFKVTGKVFEYIEVKRKRLEYGSDSNRTALLTEAVDKVLARDGKDALKDFDGIFFLYAGNRVQTSRGGLYWPHRASFNHQGKRWSYFICPEGGDNMASISVIAHEFGHMLGLPDLYTRPEAPELEGVGIWCTMSTGHGRDGKPLHFSAWCKEQMGWLNPTIIDPTVKQKLILSPVVNSTSECYKVLLRPDGSEYLLLENRVKKQFDRDLPAEGLLIWRIANGRPVLEVSHGNLGPGAVQRFLGSVPYPSKANNAFTPLTTPASKSSHPDALPVHITNIRKLPDGRVAFWIGYEFL